MQAEKKLLHHTLLLGASTVISKVAVFFLMPLYTAYLTPADFGTMDILVSTAVLLIPPVSLNAPEAVFRFCAGGEEEHSVFSNGLIFVAVGTLLFALGLPLFGFSRVLSPYRYFLFFYVVASMLRSFLAHYLRGQGKYTVYALQQFFCVAVTVSLELLFLTVLKMGVKGYLLAIILADAITFLILLFHTSPWRLFSFHALNRSLGVRMLRYALPLIPTAILWWVMSVSDRYALLYYHGEALTGLYAAAGRIPAVLTLGVSVFMEAWHYAVLHEREERARLFDRIYGALLPVTALIAALLIFCAGPVISHIYASNYSEAAYYVPFLAVASFLSGIVTFLGSVYTVKLRSSSSFFTALAGAATNLLLNFLWIPRGGAIGAAFATLLSYFLIFLLRAIHAKRLMTFSPRIGKVALISMLLLVTSLLSVNGYTTTSIGVMLLLPLLLWREIQELTALFRQLLPKSWKKRQKTRRRY